MRSIKVFLIDTITNIIYWHPVLGAAEVLFFGYTWEQMLIARAGNFLLSGVMGGFYGQAIDMGRRLAKVSAVKNKNLHTTYLLFTDALTTTIFWNIIFAFWLHYIVLLSWLVIGTATIGYTIIYLVFGGPYGVFLNWMRAKIKE